MDKLYYQVVLADGTNLPTTQFVLIDKEHDLALVIIGNIKASQQPFIHVRFKTEPAKELEEGQKVIVIGTPFDPQLAHTVSEGILAGIRKGFNGLQITAPISSGSSGSPVLDEDGDLIGVAEAIISSPEEGTSVENLNFAIDAKYVVDLYNKYHEDYADYVKKQRTQKPGDIQPQATPTPPAKPRGEPQPTPPNPKEPDGSDSDDDGPNTSVN